MRRNHRPRRLWAVQAVAVDKRNLLDRQRQKLLDLLIAAIDAVIDAVIEAG